MERFDENNKEEVDGVYNILGNIFKFVLIVKDYENIDMLFIEDDNFYRIKGIGFFIFFYEKSG